MGHRKLTPAEIAAYEEMAAAAAKLRQAQADAEAARRAGQAGISLSIEPSWKAKPKNDQEAGNG